MEIALLTKMFDLIDLKCSQTLSFNHQYIVYEEKIASLGNFIAFSCRKLHCVIYYPI